VVETTQQPETAAAVPHAIAHRTVWLASTIAGALTAIVAALVFRRGTLPFEDAAILFRYSENVAGGWGIVYNQGGERVDGATDMLFMITQAGLITLGMPTITAAAVLNAIGLGVLVGVVVAAWMKWSGPAAGWAAAPVALILLGPVWLYGISGFATMAFAGACAAVAFVSEVAARSGRRSHLILLGVVVAICGLERPEGFIIGGAIVLAQAVRVRSWRVLLLPLAVIVPVGLAFLAWRWSYFGYPLPNPFYKKGGGQLYPSGLKTALQAVARTAWPVIALGAIGLAFRASRGRALMLLGLTAFWSLLWVLLSDEMNYEGRFQYPIVGVLVVLAAPLVPDVVAGLRKAFPQWRSAPEIALSALLVLGLLTTASAFGQPTRNVIGTDFQTQMSMPASIAQTLSEVNPSSTRILASSEAGYVAWQSGWSVKDLWGLNDKAIAHDGYLTVDQLEELNPDAVFIHWCKSNQPAGIGVSGIPCLPDWEQMTDPVQCFVAKAGYVPAGLWIDAADYSWGVYLNPELEDLDELKAALDRMPANGRMNTVDEGDLPPPAGGCQS
jgi:hypothetical protein